MEEGECHAVVLWMDYDLCADASSSPTVHPRPIFAPAVTRLCMMRQSMRALEKPAGMQSTLPLSKLSPVPPLWSPPSFAVGMSGRDGTMFCS